MGEEPGENLPKTVDVTIPPLALVSERNRYSTRDLAEELREDLTEEEKENPRIYSYGKFYDGLEAAKTVEQRLKILQQLAKEGRTRYTATLFISYPELLEGITETQVRFLLREGLVNAISIVTGLHTAASDSSSSLYSPDLKKSLDEVLKRRSNVLTKFDQIVPTIDPKELK